ncbi:MAG: protein TolR [Methylococcales bacterium]|jgi:biopolymer transport protein TolR|nr:protein TolR [Methylococcales bacterium]
MSRKTGRRKPIAEINVVPYIDVTLVLLIIFMITTPLLQTGVDVDLPNAEAKTVEPKKEPPIIVSIDKQGQFFIDVGDHQEKPVEEGDVLTRVAAVIKNKPETPIFIRGDKEVDYGKVVTIMAALKNAGVPSVGLMTTPKQ